MSDNSYSYVFAKFQIGLRNAAQESAARTIPTFLTLYIFGFVYELLLVYDALRLKNTIQVIGLCLFNLALLIYAAVQMDQIKDAVTGLLSRNEIEPSAWPDSRPFLIAIPCIIAVGTAQMAVIAWKLYDEFAWTIYKHISADLRMKRRYLTYQVGTFTSDTHTILTPFRFTLLSSSSTSFSSLASSSNSWSALSTGPMPSSGRLSLPYP